MNEQYTNEPLTIDPAARLTELYRSWGILDLLGLSVDELPPEWLRILNIARNLLDGHPIPGVGIPTTVAALLAREEEVVYERRRVRRLITDNAHHIPDDPEVRPIESVSEFPRIIMSQRLWQFIDPEIFYYRVYAHDVLVKEKEEIRALLDDRFEETEELVPVANRQRRPRQKVLVLRDTSSSMRDNHKGIFAKAVALAYLIKAQEEGAEVSDRSFANTVHPRLRATTPEGFATVARRILREGFYGTTNLAAALEDTIVEIRKEELGLDPYALAVTEILLISDCENPDRLPPLPPGVTINTLHLEGGREGYMLPTYAERLEEIQGVSQSFVRIDTSSLTMPPAAREAWSALEEARLEAADDAHEAGYDAARTLDQPGSPRTAAQLSRLYEQMTRGTTEHGQIKTQLRGMYLGDKAGLGQLLRQVLRRLIETLTAAPHLRPHLPLHPRASVPHGHAPSAHDFVVRPKR